MMSFFFSTLFSCYHLASAYHPDNKMDTIWFGINRDGYDDLDSFHNDFEILPVCYVYYTQSYPLKEYDKTKLLELGNKISNFTGCILLTQDLSSGLSSVNNDNINEYIEYLKQLENTGAHIILRWAHEMNGGWNSWGMKPIQYTSIWKQIYNAVKSYTINIKLMWNPNIADGYPFDGYPNSADKSSNEERYMLDTNGDGIINAMDDPYLPFYPGDEYVDWVGLSIYHWGEYWPWYGNSLAYPNKFVEIIKGNHNRDVTKQYNSSNRDFHELFALRKNKPMAISETGAFYNVDVGDNPNEYDVKSFWWEQVFNMEDGNSNTNVQTAFPQIKMINWFDNYKNETSEQNTVRVDWRISFKNDIRDRFIQFITRFSNIKYGNDFNKFMKDL
jgi:hypothetical protein